ncbi:MAG: hypothetical protein PHS24_02360 [Bacilli bacterium]|nr:hypothetical protein [Bacilli bacterium]
MKDATGELSMTAIAVVAIAAIGVVFTTLIWPNIRAGIIRNTYCSQAFNCEGTGEMLTCDYVDEDGKLVVDGVTCPAEDKVKLK